MLNSSINNFNGLARNLSHNQLILESRILQIQHAIKTTSIQLANNYYYFLTQMVLNQITAIYQTIYNIFDKVEIAISFAKLNTLHNSIVRPIDLFSEIQSIEKYLTDVKLPLEPTLDNILGFENIINIKSYSKNYEIIFILEIPLVEPNTYQYYQLYPLPMKHDKSYHMILPKNSYLALSDNNFILSNDKCKEISTEEYLCNNMNPTKISNNAPCEVNLLKFSKNINNCYPIPININELQIQKIINEKLIVIAPQPLVAIQQCKNIKDNIPLFGSYIIDLDSICTINIENHILKTYSNSKINFKKIDLPKLNLESNSSNKLTSYNPGTFNLNLINTHQLLKTQKELESQRQELNNINNSVYISKPSIWTILLYIIFILLIVYLIYTKCFLKLKIKNNTTNNSNNDIII